MDVKNLDTENLEHLKLKDIGKNIKKAVSTAVTNVKSTTKDAIKSTIDVKNKVGDVIISGANTLKEEAKKLADKGILAGKYIPLLPFKPVMRVALQKKGVSNPPSDIGELAYMFYERVIKGRNSYEFYYQKQYNSNNLSHISKVEEQDTAIAQAGGSAIVNAGAVLATGGTNPQAIDGLVKSIIDFIKKIMDKKKSADEGGAPLNADEKIIVEESEKVEAKLDNAIASADAPKNWFKDNLPLILLVGAVVIFLVVRKK